jgi:molybdate transport system substrate-binding protein
VAERLVDGQADLAIHQISEILPVQGATLVGPLPDAIQNYTTYDAAATAASPESANAAALARALTSNEAKPVFAAAGID